MRIADRTYLAACRVHRPTTHGHYLGVKVAVTGCVLAALLAPEGIQLPLAVGANFLWIWLEP
ncbi:MULTISPECIES: hypothetical protein [unclassified Sphingomonas]|uniref:hypothetical protein n=1 Tax=unclassified Sphingomonas TaxID=196159 RepID=UPI002150C45D|nr:MULTISPECIES: hypothetical protein [unclassified Sphingomonas]MCR5870652.1 hypothetical protein [Sphingomonas sp. J344]UUY01009.1 hypothetical protein LRS08_08130 [Sphingomonas sp. J315]